MRATAMSEPFLRLAILLAIFLTCVAVIEEAMYLAIAVIEHAAARPLSRPSPRWWLS